MKFRLILAFAALFLALLLFSQETEIKPVTIGDPMPDFTLPTYQGGTLTFSSLKGKSVMIVFPRGYAAEYRWCTICNYKYAELMDLEKIDKLRKTYNLEILYVFPYARENVKEWLEVLPDQLTKIKGWKNPPEPEKMDEKTRTTMERARKGFPKDLTAEKGKVETPFPILLDVDRKLTKGLGLFMTEWGGSKVDQLIPSIFLVDRQGVVQFKYLGQNTWDRPGWDYLMRILAAVDRNK